MAEQKVTRKLPSAPPVKRRWAIIDKTPYKTPDEVRTAAYLGKPVSEGVQRGLEGLSRMAAEIMVKQGLEILGPDVPTRNPPEGVPLYKPMGEKDRAARWIADEWGLSNKGAFYRLAQEGLVRSLIDLRAQLPAVSNRTLAPLIELLPASTGPNIRPDRSDKIGSTFTKACENGEISRQSIQAAVDKVLGNPPATTPTFEESVQRALRAQLDRVQKRGGHKETEKLITRAWESLS